MQREGNHRTSVSMMLRQRERCWKGRGGWGREREGWRGRVKSSPCTGPPRPKPNRRPPPVLTCQILHILTLRQARMLLRGRRRSLGRLMCGCLRWWCGWRGADRGVVGLGLAIAAGQERVPGRSIGRWGCVPREEPKRLFLLAAHMGGGRLGFRLPGANRRRGCLRTPSAGSLEFGERRGIIHKP